MQYYEMIKETLIKNEVYKKVKDYSKNKSDLNAYFEVGRLIVEAQGGETRAKYGNKLIKECSEKLTKELGKGYNITSLKGMRQFFIKSPTLSDQLYFLNWSQILEIIYFEDDKKINYYIEQCIIFNLSVRELRERIKSKEYERIGKNIKLEEPKVNNLIKNPILIKVKNKDEKLTEYALHHFILENMEDFLKELGIGFAFIGNCFVVIELKVTELKAEYIGQITKYINYVDKHIKEVFHEKTVGVIICKKENKYVMEYCTNPNIFVSTYQTI